MSHMQNPIGTAELLINKSLPVISNPDNQKTDVSASEISKTYQTGNNGILPAS